MTDPAYAGILAAFPTPTQQDGAINEESLRRLVNFLIDNGCSSLVPVGGTGEFTAMSPQQRLDCVRITVDEAAGRVPVVAGVLSPGMAEAVESGIAFREGGAESLLVIAPFYGQPSQEGIRSYYAAYKAAVNAPVLCYDMPGKTGVAIEADTVIAMERDGSICGMKCCSIDMHYFNLIATGVSDAFSLLSGEDTLYPFHALMGARGGILATATILPAYWVDIYRKVSAGDYKGAMTAQQKLLPFLKALFREPNPGPMKALMTSLGLPAGEARLPLVPPSEDTLRAVETAVDSLLAAGTMTHLAA